MSDNRYYVKSNNKRQNKPRRPALALSHLESQYLKQFPEYVAAASEVLIWSRDGLQESLQINPKALQRYQSLRRSVDRLSLRLENLPAVALN